MPLKVNDIAWIQDFYHEKYPHYVRIIEVLPDGYKAQVLYEGKTEGPVFTFKEDQLTQELI